MSAVPAWKLALLERKKQQEEEEKAKQAKVEEAKIASLPAWKRAIVLREKQGKGSTSAPTPTNNSAPSAPKWQVAVERVKGADSPILNKRPSWKSANAAPPLSSKPAAKAAPPPSSAAPSSPKLTTTKNLVANRWKHATTSLESSNKESSNKETAKTFNSSSVHAKTSASTATSEADDDPSLVGLPPWKRALILKKRAAQKKPVITEQVEPTGEDEPDSASPTNVSPAAAVQNSPQPVEQPEVVNRSNGEGSSQRLVEQEGKTLHPPVYKEVDEWANVKEQDDKFKELPLWKQALIKRRREDIAKRSGLPVPPTTYTPPNPATQSSPLVKKAQRTPVKKTQNTKKPNNKKAHTNAIENKRNSKTVSHERKKKGGTDRLGNQSSKVQREISKPVRKAPAAPTAKKEPMFTYSFSKSSSSHRTLDTGGSSSDSTDSDLEDAVITNLDDDSDEGDSGIVLQSYSVTKTSSQPSPTLGQKSVSETAVNEKPATSNSGKKKHMRRVSWSDTQLVSEHYYPKYDYSDYDDIEREEANKNKFMAALAKENSGLSHRLHPSLRHNNDSDGYGYGGFSPTSPSPRNTTSENSLSSFVPKTLSGHSPQMLAGYTDLNPDAHIQAEENGLPEELETVQEQTDDFYDDFTSSNTAALLW